ncbi:hypothetical protein KCP69_23680 [Salmonella enterica subsp. enterica]|nr:hypothetical protein KCP69_23680 [Salmonella enterica subsp. enterica]
MTSIRGGGAGKQVDHRRTEQAELCGVRLMNQPVRGRRLQYDNFRHIALHLL